MPTWPVTFNLIINISNPEVVKLTAEAHALAKSIRGVPITPGIRRKIDNLNIMRAVRGTTGLEGSTFSEEEVSKILMDPKTSVVLPGRERERQEVLNAAEAMKFIMQIIHNDPQRPISEALIKEIHKIITKNIDYQNNISGVYRSHSVSAAQYIPPRTNSEVCSLMKQFIDFMTSDPVSHFDPIVKGIIAHFYTNSIHPFGDGNGRTARALESFFLYQGKINARGFYSLANFFYSNRDKYIETLDSVRFQSKDLTSFILFALRGLVEELEWVHRTVIEEVTRIAFRDYAREKISTANIHAKVKDRMTQFVVGLTEEDAPISIKQLKSGKHYLFHLYAKQKEPERTLNRDIDFLKERELVHIDGDNLEANINVMKQFSAESDNTTLIKAEKKL